MQNANKANNERMVGKQLKLDKKSLKIKMDKQKDLSSQLKVVFLEALKKRGAGILEEEEGDLQGFNIPEEEIKLAEEFLRKFTVVSENSLNDHLDIFLMLRALPNRIM